MTDNDKPVFGFDDPNRGPIDRAANALTGETGGVSNAINNTPNERAQGNQIGIVSAIFDSNAEAQEAVSALRQLGATDSDLSIIAQSKGTMTTREGGGEVTDEEHTSILRGILGGGALGAGLGVAALAIPGVGPLAAIGAIAASVVPEAMAIGAVAGAAAGTFNEALKKHGIDDGDAAYYGDNLKSGGVLITVSDENIDRSQAQEVLYANGGHSSSRARTAAM